jgi:hypothetical protein
MGRKSILLTLVLVVVAVLIGMSSLLAQRLPSVPPPLPGLGDPVGRFTVIKVADGGWVFLLDTATGEFYKANLDDAKPHKDRPKVGSVQALPFPAIGGDKDFPRDKDGNPFRDGKDLREKDSKRDGFKDFKDGFKDAVKDGFKDAFKDGKDSKEK